MARVSVVIDEVTPRHLELDPEEFRGCTSWEQLLDAVMALASPDSVFVMSDAIAAARQLEDALMEPPVECALT